MSLFPSYLCCAGKHPTDIYLMQVEIAMFPKIPIKSDCILREEVPEMMHKDIQNI